MQKTELAYRGAVRKLDAAVKRARELHEVEIQKLDAAKKNLDSYPPSQDAMQAARRQIAQGELDQVKNGFRPAVYQIYQEYDTTVAAARRELVEAMNAADTYKAKDIDAGALALIQSHVMRPKDLAQMAEDFSENAAVLALVRQEAKRQWEASTAPEEAATRAELMRIIENAQTTGERFLKGFDDLNQGAHTLSGRNNYGDFVSGDRLLFNSLSAWETLTAGLIPGDDGDTDGNEE